jgi:hypothetical protein
MKKFLLAIFLLFFAVLGRAETLGASVNWGGAGGGQYNIPTKIYVPLIPKHIEWNDFPPGTINLSPTDFMFTMFTSGIVRITGQLLIVLDWTRPLPSDGSYVVKLFKDAPCSNDPAQVVLPAEMGSPSGNLFAFGAWSQVVPINVQWRFSAGAVLRWCLYSTGNPTSYIEGTKSHSHIDISITP